MWLASEAGKSDWQEQGFSGERTGLPDLYSGKSLILLAFAALEPGHGQKRTTSAAQSSGRLPAS